MKYFILFVFVLFFSLAQAQENAVISGKVLDAEGYSEPLLMANVALRDTDWSTQTNFSGNFELTDVIPGAYILHIDFLGYERLELLVRVSAGERLELLPSLKAKTLPFLGTGLGDKKEPILAEMADTSLKK